VSISVYPSYRATDSKWLGSVPSHWVSKRFKQVFSEREERSGNGEEELLSVSAYTGVRPRREGIPDGDHLSRAESLEGYKRCYPDDLVMNIMLAWNRGLGFSQYDGIVSPAYCVFRVIDDCDTRFLDYLVRSENYTGYFKSFSAGVIDSRLRLYPDVFLSLPVALPLPAEQRAIAAFLDRETAKIDALAEEQRQFIKLLKEKRQAVISDAVTKGLDAAARTKNSGVEWLGNVPAHWEVKRIRFLCDIGTGDADTANAIEDGKYPFFVRSPIIERISEYSHDCEAVLTAGDGAGVGKVYHHFQGKFRAHQRVYIFSNFRGVRGRFFFSYMSEMFAKVVLEGTAKSTVESLRRPMIADFWMTIPPTQEQDDILIYVESAVSSIDALIAEATGAIKLLEERHAALISAAVTGKIDVRGFVPQHAEVI
jgi:type I restriction enzyme S subunit